MLPLLKYENKLWSNGLTHIAGVDEAGRGPLAGPIVIAAVILDKNHLHTNSNTANELLETYALINDSKKVTPKRRELLYAFILENAIAHQIEEISAKKIDEWGISKSNQIGFFYAAKKLATQAEHILTDHFGINALPENKQTNITRGDSASISIAAASILAKVHRDKIMVKYHEKFPEYGFDKHKGYGTELHRNQLHKLGSCEIHRKSFKLTR